LRYVVFLIAGTLLGYALNTLANLERRASVSSGKGRAIALMTLRLVVFVVAVGWISRSYGPLPGILVLTAAVITRTMLVRAAVKARTRGGSAPESKHKRLP
jgi:hypothetical protein